MFYTMIKLFQTLSGLFAPSYPQKNLPKLTLSKATSVKACSHKNRFDFSKYFTKKLNDWILDIRAGR